MAADAAWEDLDWARLAEWVYARRRNRGMRSRGLFAAKAGVSERTLGELERGLPVGKQTLLAVDAALYWVAGSCERILNGGEPLQWPHQAPGFWDDRGGQPDVAEQNPRPEAEIDRSSVGGDSEDGSYVADRSPNDPPARITNDEVLAVIRRQKQELEELERRMIGEGPVDGAS